MLIISSICVMFVLSALVVGSQSEKELMMTAEKCDKCSCKMCLDKNQCKGE